MAVLVTPTIFDEDLAIDSRQAVSQFKRGEFKPGDSYRWRKDSDIWMVARRMNVNVKRLMEFNEIEDPKELEAGILVYFPSSSSKKRKTIIELLPEPRPMHISKIGGTKKWAFGHMTTWDDAESAGGFYPENTNVDIVAIARVPIDDKDDPAAEAAYYLDSRALGDYAQTQRVKLTVGYAWSDLAEGHIEKTAAPPPPVAQIAIEKQEADNPPADIDKDGFDRNFVEKRLEDTIKEGLHNYKETYQELVPPVPCIAMIPEDAGEVDPTTGTRFIWVRDFDTRRSNRRLLQYQEVTISATFEYDGDLYGRPVRSVENFVWYGIPMNMLQSQAELFMYNKRVDATTRFEQGGQLTLSERYFWVPMSKALTVYKPSFMRHIKNKNNVRK